MSYCVAFGCANRPADKVIGITFHRFPKDERMRKKWMDAMRKDDWTPHPNSKVCSVHFKPTDILRNSPLFTKLKKDAVPCTFPQTFKQSVPKSIKELENNSKIEVIEINDEDYDDDQSMDSTTSSVTKPTSNLSEQINKNFDAIGGKTLFNIINELADEMNGIRRRVNKHLKTKRVKNCRLKSQVDKLKKSLIETKEQNAKDNPMLANLFDHALREPDTTPMEEERIPNNLVELVEEETIEVQPGSPEKSEPKKDSFAVFLSTELEKLSPEDFTTLKNDIKNIIRSHNPNQNVHI